MFRHPPSNRRRILLLLGAYAFWTAVSIPMFPVYARIVTSAASTASQMFLGHESAVVITSVYPTVAWHPSGIPAPSAEGSTTSFRLLAHNLILYLSILTVLPIGDHTRRAMMAASGLLILFVCHVLDLLIVMESSRLGPPGTLPTDLSLSSLWFSSVKVYQSMSVLALKQAIPFLLLLIQSHIFVPESGLRNLLCLPEPSTNRSA